jgi:hypothetical protein
MSIVAASLEATTEATRGVPNASLTPAEPIFLQTKAAQGIAGAFVWVALVLTCHQVCTPILYVVKNRIFIDIAIIYNLFNNIKLLVI